MRLRFVPFLIGLVAPPGCGETTPSTPAPPAFVAPPPIQIDSIAPGERPSTIQGADFFKASDFHHAGVSDGTSVCIEGVVERTGVVLGAPFVQLTCESCGRFVHCEGGALDRYQIAVGSTIIVRGHVFSGNSLGGTNIVTQDQIDAALKESHAAHE